MASETLLKAVVLCTIVLFCPQGCEGAVTETTASIRPPFSFACGSQVGGSAPTFCSAAAGDKKYVKVESVEIYRDYSNEVGKCLEPEKGYIMALLTDWFNYGCKIPNVERDDEIKRMPVDYLKESMTKYCGVKNADVVRIIVDYYCVKNLSDGTASIPVKWRDDRPTIPPRVPIVIVQDVSTRTASPTSTAKSTTEVSTSRAPTSPAAAWTPSVGQPDDIPSTSTVGKDDEAVATPSSGSSGWVTETTAYSRPPFSFACGSQVGGSAPTFCGAAAGDKKYVKVNFVEIFRDKNNEVGKCLEPEKIYVMDLLTDWFNYGCKIPNVERDDEKKKMPVDYLKDSMTKYCGLTRADVTRIVVHYECVKKVGDVKITIPVPLCNVPLRTPSPSPIMMVNDVSRRTGSTTEPTSKASPAVMRTPSVGPPGDISSSKTAEIETGAWIAIGFALVICLLTICGLLFILRCWLPSRREKRKQELPPEVGVQTMSILYLVPGKY